MSAGGRPAEPDRVVLRGPDVQRERLDDWRLLFGSLHARFATGDFATALALVAEVGAEAERADHHPELDLGWGWVRARLTSHDVGGVSPRDIRLARAVSAAAARLGAHATPAELSVLELGLDTPDAEQIKPFWAALLGYRPTETDPVELVDPHGVRPTLWFQDSEPDPEVPAQRFHLDVRLAPEMVEDRIAAALAAGGTLVSDAQAPRFWVLADAQGNRACLTTWQGRDG